MLKLCKIHACPNGTLGLHLSRAPWDPYPWVSGVQNASNAYQAGVRSGDTVLELNGCDVLGQKISELAGMIRNHWQRGGSFVTVLVWRNKTDNENINQQSLQKFAKCLQQIAQLLECPICLEVVKPPGWQCCNGHVLCNSCRGRTVKCPICRVTLGPRGRCLLSDKLFTLLAESFPCDGVRNGNRTPDCSQDYIGCHDSPPPSPLTSMKIKTTSAAASPSSSPSLDKVRVQDHQITINNKGNDAKQLKEPDEDTNQQRPAYSRRRRDDNNIVVLKLNSKSKRKNSSMDHTSSCHHHPHHHHHHHRHHSHHSHQGCQSHCGRPLPGQQQTSFHCPTGKSSCSLLPDNPPLVVVVASNNNSSPDPDTKTLNCSWTQDDGHKPKGEEKIETLARFITEWDVLSHLTRVHQISVAQHYTTFDQAVRVQFLNSKSMPCITIQSENIPDPNKENFKNDANVSVGGGFIPAIAHTIPCKDARCKNSRITRTLKNVQRSRTELFFVACIPLLEVEEEEEVASDFDWNKVVLRNGRNDTDGYTRGYMSRLQSEFDGCSDVGATLPSTTTDGHIAGECPDGGVATKSESTGRNTHSQAAGNLRQDSSPEHSSFHATVTGTLQSQVNDEHRSPTNCRCACTYRLKVESDVSTWSSTSSSSSSLSCSSTSSSSSGLSSSSSSVCSTPSYSSSLASFSMSNCSSYRHCSSNANTKTNTGTTATRHAVFIWYFGNECDAKNYQTVIECKRTGLKWTGCIHPLTESWPSIQERHRQGLQLQQHHKQQQDAEQFLVLDSTPDGGDNFFDIAIKIK